MFRKATDRASRWNTRSSESDLKRLSYESETKCKSILWLGAGLLQEGRRALRRLQIPLALHRALRRHGPRVIHDHLCDTRVLPLFLQYVRERRARRDLFFLRVFCSSQKRKKKTASLSKARLCVCFHPPFSLSPRLRARVGHRSRASWARASYAAYTIESEFRNLNFETEWCRDESRGSR